MYKKTRMGQIIQYLFFYIYKIYTKSISQTEKANEKNTHYQEWFV